MMDGKKIIVEYSVVIGEDQSAGIFKVVKGFFLKTKNGPLVLVEPGMLVELGEESARSLAYYRIEPLNLPEKFRVLRPFRTVDANGFYLNLRENDEIAELCKEEALKLLRDGFIKSISEKSEVAK